MENDYWELKMIVEKKSLKFVFMSCIVHSLWTYQEIEYLQMKSGKEKQSVLEVKVKAINSFLDIKRLFVFGNLN